MPTWCTRDPNLLRRRVPTTAATRDERDAEALSCLFRERDRVGVIARLFEPALMPPDRRLARREGWILGVA